MAESVMVRVLSLVAWSVMIVILLSSPAHARHHKKKKPTPTPSPSARIQNPVNAPDHAELRPEDLMWLNQ